MPAWEKIAAMCTGPRVTLLAVLATVNTLLLFSVAEVPLTNALQAAVAVHRAVPERPLPPSCDAQTFAREPGPDRPLASFDGRSGGYGVEQANAILCAMTMNGGAGRRAYLERHFPLDMLFPLLYGPALAALFLFLLGEYGWRAHALKYLALAPLLAGALDLAENLIVRSLVVAGPPADPQWISIASALTRTKYLLVNASIVVVFALLLWYLARRSLARRPVN